MIGKLFVLMVIVAAATATDKVRVTIYYESLCDDSKNFFNQQFKPTWNDLKAYMDLELVPFGKSNSTDYSKPNQVQPMPFNANFTCHHGENECLGNKYQACILNKQYTFTWDNRINMISCLMSKLGTTTPYEQTFNGCLSNPVSVDAPIINDCVRNPMVSNELLLANERTTNAFEKPIKSVPTIVFNREGVATVGAVKNFRGHLCDRITDTPKPKSCEGYSGAPATTVGLITLFAAGLVIRML